MGYICPAMDRPLESTLRIGDWSVNPALGQISRGDDTIRVEARTMRLLLCLAGHAGEVVSIDELLSEVWSGVIVTPDSVYQAVASLRRLLGDDPRQPAYIATVPRLGYRMVAKVDSQKVGLAPPDPAQAGNGAHPEMSPAPAPAPAPVKPGPKRRRYWMPAVALGLIAGGLIAYLLVNRGLGVHSTAGFANAARDSKSIAVLPFLDLTDGMKEEVFADGMTEELIDKLSQVRGLRVPAPTSSFYFKGKKITVADIAKSLGVAYILDGSVRKSGAMLRVAARLIRADDGYVVWSETYDRPWDDKLMVQDDIAGEVTKALRASIN
ncbi:MAG TPA: winged helix-turn-helix domain-containing protein [Steroidobacteraceae bacterium]|jgi:transcriptional activator of cad operon|nr:winged helix-turn-helix domain-containing protein [Steroidobacteraceae bacterium]